VVLAGLDYIDTVFTDFIGALDAIIRNGKDCMAKLPDKRFFLHKNSGNPFEQHE
jgi:hypothetical protein